MPRRSAATAFQWNGLPSLDAFKTSRRLTVHSGAIFRWQERSSFLDNESCSMSLNSGLGSSRSPGGMEVTR